MTSGDFCYACDGTGERNWISGAPCYECGGSGWREDDDEQPVEGSCERCGCDLDANDWHGLCDQCEWAVERSNGPQEG